MRLITISDNVVANAESIDCIEQKISRGTSLTYVWIGNRSYVLEVPLEEFYKSLENSGEIKQIFGG